MKASEPIMAIVPDSGEVFGNVLLPQEGSGKVNVGQTAKISIDGYPAVKFGRVEGVVQDISLVAEDKSYVIKVKIPKGLKTN